MKGKEIFELVNEYQSAGSYEVFLNSNELSSGIYFYSFYYKGIHIKTNKLTVIK
ncbi:MAG: hypothetical protein R3A12_14610 [Ignavibacteria bacterium]